MSEIKQQLDQADIGVRHDLDFAAEQTIPDPAIHENVTGASAPTSVQVITLVDHTDWTVRRVFSQYASREVFTDPYGVEWVRVSRDAFNPDRGDIQIALKTRGLEPIRVRRRDAFVANLRNAK
jgi:hypothetical protein